jgi:O-antigen ligase
VNGAGAHPLIRAGEGISRVMLVAPMAALAGIVLFSLLYLYPPTSAAMVLAACAGLTGVLALALARYDLAATLGVALLGVVAFEPAPPDLVFGIVIAVAIVTGRFYVSAVPTPILGLLAAFLALNLISVVEAIEPGRALVFLSITVYLMVFSIWMAGFVQGHRHARLVVLGYTFAALSSAAVGVGALLVSFPGSDVFLLDGCCRAKGLFEDSNVYGPFLVPAALIMLQETIEPRLLRVGRPWKALMFMLLMAGVLLSFSRGAWINAAVGVAVVVAVLLLRRGGARRMPAVLAVLALAGIALGVIVSAGGEADFLQQRTGFQAYDVERFSAQRTGLQLASEYPLGIGPGQFEEVSPVATHSTYIRVLAEQGVVGLFGFLALMLATLLLAVWNAALGRSTYGIGSAALLGAWCGLMVNSLAVDTLHWRHLWLVAALIWVASLRQRAAPQQS